MISVAVCTWNRAEVLRVALESLIALDHPDYEVVVIDDGSTDHTRTVVDSVRAVAKVPMRYVHQENAGIAAARNRAVAEAQGAWIAFCDDDQRADPAWLGALVRAAAHTGARCLGGPIYLDLPADTTATLGPVRRGMLGEHDFGTTPHRFEGKEVPSSGNLFVEMKVFEEAGTFDITLSSGEDADFVRRVRGAGIDLWSAPEAIMYHLIPAERLKEGYFRWVAFRWGAQFATIDHKTYGAAGLALRALLRLAQGLLITLPKRTMAKVSGNTPAAGDAQCLLWRMEAYLRQGLQLLAPGLFPQRAFLDALDFRKERLGEVEE